MPNFSLFLRVSALATTFRPFALSTSFLEEISSSRFERLSILSGCIYALESIEEKHFSSHSWFVLQNDRCSTLIRWNGRYSRKRSPRLRISAYSWKRWRGTGRRGFWYLRATDFVARLHVEGPWSVGDRDASIRRADAQPSARITSLKASDFLPLLQDLRIQGVFINIWRWYTRNYS